MAWGEVKVVEQRKLFVKAYLEDSNKMAELCRQFGISRKIGYKWVKRYEEEGSDGLQDRSRAPLQQAGATNPKLTKEILKVRHKYPRWGPKKVRAWLQTEYPLQKWPSTTTIGNLFDKNGLTVPRKLRRRVPVRTEPLVHCQELNDVWCIDFKGWFLTKDGHKCEPFTLTDAYSRYLLRCLKLNINDTNHVWAVLDTVFREYGLPLYIRSDNGPPFATSGAGRLSPLAVRLIKAGVIPEWIEPGEPQQNGRHERMHLTLKQEGIFPSTLTLEEQQMKFKEFQHYYNFIRPHEALEQKPPGSLYQSSSRTWSGRLRSPEYPDDYKVGRVKSCGKMSWRGGEIYISRSLACEPIGLKESEEGLLKAYFGPIFLGVINLEGELEIVRRSPRKKGQTRSKKEMAD
jgi:putative transposase